jgi:hypothetical protein
VVCLRSSFSSCYLLFVKCIYVPTLNKIYLILKLTYLKKNIRLLGVDHVVLVNI